MSDTAQIPSIRNDGQIPAYVARPSGAPKAAIIVIPEIFGVNPGIRQKADSWAAKGYLAVAPDILCTTSSSGSRFSAQPCSTCGASPEWPWHPNKMSWWRQP